MHLGRKGSGFPNLAVLLLFLLSFSTVGLFYICSRLHGNLGSVSEGVGAGEHRVQGLINLLREASSLAAGGPDDSTFALTERQRKEWDLANPCRSRIRLKSIYSRRVSVVNLDGNPRWEAVLEEYAKLHRTCRQRVDNLKEYFLSGNTSVEGCKFAVADFSVGGGLGNKILAITDTILYSILTQRVVLVPSATLVPALMCEPFPGSSWVLEEGDDIFPTPPWEGGNAPHWKDHTEVYGELDGTRNRSATKDSKSSIHSAAMTYYQYQPDSRFFCETEQARFASVTWLYFTGCLYTIPRFFSIPSFRPTLEALFPDRFVLAHLLRSVMLPEDLVWERIVRADAAYTRSADRLLGVQIRYRRNFEEYKEMNSLINERIMTCALENGILPPAIEFNTSNSSMDIDRVSSPVVKIFVASLFTGFREFLSQTYLQKPTSTGEVVGLVQLSHETTQTYGLAVDRQSLIEIMLLSFSDVLFITPLSTFGGLAQAYGALVPWILDYRKGADFGPCERGQTVDLCYQEAQFRFYCPYDSDVNGKIISDVVPYIRDCLEVDSQEGILPGFQLITDNAPSSWGSSLSSTPRPTNLMPSYSRY